MGVEEHEDTERKSDNNTDSKLTVQIQNTEENKDSLNSKQEESLVQATNASEKSNDSIVAKTSKSKSIRDNNTGVRDKISMPKKPPHHSKKGLGKVNKKHQKRKLKRKHHVKM